MKWSKTYSLQLTTTKADEKIIKKEADAFVKENQYTSKALMKWIEHLKSKNTSTFDKKKKVNWELMVCNKALEMTVEQEENQKAKEEKQNNRLAEVFPNRKSTTISK